MIEVFNKGHRTIFVEKQALTAQKKHEISEETAKLLKKMYPEEFVFFGEEEKKIKKAK